MTSFLVTWPSNVYICRVSDGLSACKVSMLQVVFGRFYGQIEKTQWWRHHDVILSFWNLKISNFMKQSIGYQVSKSQISWLPGSNFMEVSVRPLKPLLWRHYYVISNHCVYKLAYFIEHDISYQPSIFQCSRMSVSNFMDGGGNPQCYDEIKKPSAYRVKMHLDVV